MQAVIGTIAGLSGIIGIIDSIISMRFWVK